MGYHKQLAISLAGEITDWNTEPISEMEELSRVIKAVIHITKVEDFDDYDLNLHGRIEKSTYLVYSSDGETYIKAGFFGPTEMTNISRALWLDTGPWDKLSQRDMKSRMVAVGAVMWSNPDLELGQL